MLGCYIKPEQMFNLIWGYAGRVNENLDTIATGAGGTILSAVVPSDCAYVLQAVYIQNDSRAGLNVSIKLYDGAADGPSLSRCLALSQAYPCQWTGQVVLAPGDRVKVTYSGSQNGDAIKCSCWFYEMVLTQ